MPFLGIAADHQGQLQPGQSGQNVVPPRGRANWGRREVGALGVVPGEAERHGHDGNFIPVIERFVVHLQPIPQAVAGWVPERLAAFMDTHPGRLAGNENASAFVEPNNRSWMVRSLCQRKPLRAQSAVLEVGFDLIDLVHPSNVFDAGSSASGLTNFYISRNIEI